MYAKKVSTFCCAYILGLAIASGFNQYGLTITLFGAITGIILINIAPSYNWWELRGKTVLALVFIFLIGIISFFVRFPTATPNDISQIISSEDNGRWVTVTGKVLNSPTLNQSGKLKFWLSTEQVDLKTNRNNITVTGKLYTTIPPLQKNSLNPGSLIQVTGYLYQPSTPKNPGQFNFKEYLHKNGAFAGISGKKITVIEEANWGFWQLRDRIVDIHLEGLGTPKGNLVSSMVLGRKAVNLPEVIQDEFLRAGLAHLLSASGFHVSILLGIVLVLTQRFQVLLRLVIGLGILGIYVGLTGLQPSILRASLMGVVALLGLVTERKINSIRSLLIIATILLLINPVWIIDVGFQFSFLATLGLIVTLPVLLKKWDGLPPTVASLIAVPIAVLPWVFPLQLFHFGTVATYSIILNIFVTPFAILIIIGGIFSGLTGLIISSLGETIALLLSYPTQILISLVSSLNKLPGSYLFFGKLALWQVIGIYSLIVLVWQFPKGQKYWKVALIGAIALMIIPITYKQLTLRQITVFATKEPSAILIQNRGQVTLINCGQEDTIRYTILPFLQQEGISKIDNAIALNSDNEWDYLHAKVPIKTLFYSPRLDREINTLPNLESMSQQRISSDLPLVQNHGLTVKQSHPLLLSINFSNHQWGILNYPTQMLPNIPSEFREIDVLLWSGKDVSRSWFKQLNIESAIAVTNQISDNLKQEINQDKLNIYITGKDGAIQWTPTGGLETRLNQF